MLPDTLDDEAVGLVVAGDHGGDEQAGGLCGAMSNMERIHTKGASGGSVLSIEGLVNTFF
jgi:hypothetical protein